MSRRIREENPWLKVLPEQESEGRSGAAHYVRRVIGPLFQEIPSFFGN